MKRIVTVFVSCLMMAGMLRAQAPAGYYNHAIGLSGRALHEALATIITEGHQVVGYDELWDWFPLTDPAPEDSTLLNDMYSLCRFALTTSPSERKPRGSSGSALTFTESPCRISRDRIVSPSPCSTIEISAVSSLLV